MRITSLLRRSTAVVAATALLSAGANGLLAGTAFAVLPEPIVSSITPDASNNTAPVSTQIHGSNFVQSQDTVFLRPTFVATEVDATKTIQGSIPGGQVDPTTINATFDTTLAAPGLYDVLVTQSDVGGSITKTCGSCFSVTTIGPPNATGVASGPATPIPNSVPPKKTDRGPGAVDISGNNFARGASVQILLPNGTVDPYATFAVGNGTVTTATAYPSANLIRGNYSTSLGFTPGKHVLKVTNTDGKSGTTTELWLPYFTTVSPTQRGVGSQNQVVTITGAGIRAGSGIGIQNLDGTSGCSDVSVGAATVSADGTTISAPVSLVQASGCSPVGLAGRSVTVFGPDGASFSRANAFTATAQPTVTFPSPALKLGRGGSIDVTLYGSGFIGGTVFSFTDPKVTAVTTQVAPNGTSAAVTISAPGDAVLGGQSIIVTNPDAGTSTRGPSGTPAVPPLTINPAPVFTSIAPTSVGLGASRTVTLKGTYFESPGLSVIFSRAGLTASNLQVSKGQNGAQDTATFTATSASNTVPGLSDVIVKNASDHGASSCTGCFGVDSLSVSPAADSNSGTSLLSFNGSGLSGNSAPYLTKVGGNADQPDIHVTPGSALVLNGSTLSATFDLTNAAPGKYNAVATGSSNGVPVQLACSACFSITGQPATLTGVRRTSDAVTVTKTGAGQGAVNVPITVTGSGFSRGQLITLQTTATDMSVVPSTATVHDVRFVSTTQLTALVDVPADAATGAQDFVLSNADGQYPKTLAGGFTINAGPKPTAISPAAVGQGATAKTVTITGPGFDAASTVDFGPGITVTGVTVTQGVSSPTVTNPPDTLVATITVGEAALTGVRPFTVVNPDSGRGTLADKLTITAGPKILSISPAFLKPGDAGDVTVTGTGFKDDATQPTAPHPVVTIANVTATVNSVSADGTSMVVHLEAQTPCTAAATPACSLGARSVTVANKTDGGQTAKPAAFTVALPPVAPTNVAVPTIRPNGATVTWSFPTAAGSDGGSPLTGFVVDDGDSTTNNAVVVGPAVRTADLTGLVNGRGYTYTVKAANVAGAGPAGTAQQFATKLTSTRSPVVSISGSAVTYSGKLTRTTGVAVPGARILLTLTPDIGAARSVALATSSTGVWSYRFAPIYNTTARASFAGTGTNASSAAPTYKMGVATRVTRTAPVSGSTTSHLTILTVTGNVSPNKAGRTIALYNGARSVAIATVASNGTFAIRSKLPAGTYTLNIGIGATTGNVAGYSSNFVIRRT